MSFIQTIEHDLEAAGGWLEHEVEGAAEEVWSVVKTVFGAAEATVVNSVVSSAKVFLPTIEKAVLSGTTLENLEQMFLQWGEGQGGNLIKDAETIGSTLVQSLLGLAIKSLPALL